MQIGSALGSSLGQLVRLPERRLRLLVACGAAGGIAATFNAPIAGVFFAMELILGDFGVESFGAVVLASVTSAVIGQAVFGKQPFLQLPAFRLSSPVEFGTYALLGLLAGVVGIGFIKILYGIEDLADKLWRGPEWLRSAVGGVLLGGLLPQLYAVGYPVLTGVLTSHYLLWLLLILLVGKMLATSLTIAIGGSGGVFAPRHHRRLPTGGGVGPPDRRTRCEPAGYRLSGPLPWRAHPPPRRGCRPRQHPRHHRGTARHHQPGPVRCSDPRRGAGLTRVRRRRRPARDLT